MKRMAMVIAACCACGTFADVAHFTFPVPGHPNCGQAILNKVYDLNQKTPRRIAWGVSGRFAGIDPMLPLSHHKYGIEINPISCFQHSKQRLLCIHFWKRGQKV